MPQKTPIDVVSECLDLAYAPIFEQDKSALADSASSLLNAVPSDAARLRESLKVHKVVFASLGLGMGLLTIKTAARPGLHTAVCGLLCHDFLRMSYNCYPRAYTRQVMKHALRDVNQVLTASLAMFDAIVRGSDSRLEKVLGEAQWNAIISGTLVERLVNVLVGSG